MTMIRLTQRQWEKAVRANFAGNCPDYSGRLTGGHSMSRSEWYQSFVSDLVAAAFRSTGHDPVDSDGFILCRWCEANIDARGMIMPQVDHRLYRVLSDIPCFRYRPISGTPWFEYRP
jgi:hypothetical protein